MNFDLDKYFDEELPVLDAVDMADPSDYGERPTANEIWLWQLEERVAGLVGVPLVVGAPGRVTHGLHAHRGCLRTSDDVRSAPDDVLLEALGLPSGAGAGWLGFMRRELWIHSRVADNWGLPPVLPEYGVTRAVTGEDACPAEAVLHFLRLMGECGHDPAAVVNKIADSLRTGYRKEHRRALPEEELHATLRGLNESLYFIYLFGPVVIRGGLRVNYSPVKYTGGHRAESLAWVRSVAANRRRHQDAAHPTDCPERQEVLDPEEDLARKRRYIAEWLVGGSHQPSGSRSAT